MHTLTVNLADRSYPILIGSGLLKQQGALDAYLPSDDVLVVSNESIAPLYLHGLTELLGDRRVATAILADGEQHKTLATLESVLNRLVAAGFNRDCTVIGLGGGVVGDVAGLAAGVYQRGVNFIQVPTTLLAQVDSSVGGKTAVNHPQGKNLIGVFHQPSCVLADTQTLDSLPDRELAAGLAEVVKYGLIMDAEFFDWLEANADKLIARDAESLELAIRKSCATKAAVVAADEREQGQRALLNLGHTFGHAIERCLGYGEWLHGEAVAAGMCMAAGLSERIGWLEAGSAARIAAVLASMGLPVQPPAIDAKALYQAMTLDKKVIAGEIRLVLLKGIGEAIVTADYPEAELRTELDASLAAA